MDAAADVDYSASKIGKWRVKYPPKKFINKNRNYTYNIIRNNYREGIRVAKRRHRKKEDGFADNTYNGINNNPFGINPMQLLSMMGNVDMTEVNRMMSNMNREGFDFNNLNLNNMKNIIGNNSIGANSNNIGGSSDIRPDNLTTDSPIVEVKEKKSEVNSQINNCDENIQMLIALRSIVDGNKGKFIDRIIELYKEGAFSE